MIDAKEVIAHVYRCEPTLGGGRLICIDGLAGAGKTTLSGQLATLTGAPVVHTDDLLEGWGGLPGLGAAIERMLRPLVDGRSSTWRQWDWYASEWGDTHALEPTELLIIEGVGSGSAAYDELITTLVWVEAARDVRLERGLTRDGEATRPEWERWLEAEAALHAHERTRERADFVYSTSR